MNQFKKKHQKKTRRSFLVLWVNQKPPATKKRPEGLFLVLGSFGGIYASRRKGGENLRNDQKSSNSECGMQCNRIYA